MNEEERGRQAAEKARSRVLRHCARRIHKAMQVLDDALEAHTVKVFSYLGDVIESEPYVDHATRLRAAQLVVEWAEASPPKRMEHVGEGGGPIQEHITVEFIGGAE